MLKRPIERRARFSECGSFNRCRLKGVNDSPTPTSRLLLASIHDVSPRFEAEVDLLADRYETLLGNARYAMLVVPDFWGESPLASAPAFRTRLRRWSERGVEMLLHGWAHRDAGGHRGAAASFKARHMTAGEGEFLGLDRIEAERRLRNGRALLEDIVGRPVTGFVAPAWLYGEGARAALRDAGFAFAEDHFRVWRPSDDKSLCRGPVVTWASRSRARQASSLAFAAIARRALAPLAVARVAVHPGDAGVPALLDSIDRTVVRLATGRRAARYDDLLAATA